ELQTRAAAQADELTVALYEKDGLYTKLTAAQEELLAVSRANTMLRMSLMSLDANAGRSEYELKSWVIDLQKRIESQREEATKDKEYIRQLQVE
ncbi:uncharacterized protein V1510DRAFT_349236, partial [Dipodascopsis tothii]|uniref:uncharacterized protein n=1 Tax=Dipodascopsis tothii TaxID=44089 RepID=UPI0034CDA616